MRKEDELITLRSATVDDVDQLARWWADGKIMAHAGFPNGIQTDKAKIIADINAAKEIESPPFERLIISRNDNINIGEMSYRETDKDIYEVGIKICDFSQHNRGFGQVCMELLLEYLFVDRHASKVILDTNTRNRGAQRFYERLGFTKIGVRKYCFVDQLGRMQSAVDYEYTKDDYYKNCKIKSSL